MKHFIPLITILLACSTQLSAQNIRLAINHDDGVYRLGENVKVTCIAKEQPHDTLTLNIYSNNQKRQTTRILPADKQFTVLEQPFDSTCAITVELLGSNKLKESVGFVVAPEGFKAGYDEPADLMAYWDNQKRLLKALPMQVKTHTLEVTQKYKGQYVCQDVEINCLGPTPVRGYVAKPVNAKKKSLPIIILCRAAGVSGNWCRCQVGECVSNAALGNGALSLDINAHGFLNGQDDAYYKMLEQGMLKDYYEHNVADRESYYFKGMYLRLLRAIEYLTQQPEWDGKRILVIGESQGGGQAFAAAGLDPRVSAIAVHVPAMQDLGGARKGRRSGWPHPIENHRNIDSGMLDATLPYFDGALLIRHSKAEIYCEMGLIDTTCPPSGVWASLNGVPGKKTIRCVPFRTHSWPSGEWYKIWNEKYLQPRLQYINDYLK